MERDNSGGQNIGKEIQDMVQSAFTSMNFERLNANISATVNSALQEVKSSINNNSGITGNSGNSGSNNGSCSSTSNNERNHIETNKYSYGYDSTSQSSMGSNGNVNNNSVPHYKRVIGDTISEFATAANDIITKAGEQIANSINNQNLSQKAYGRYGNKRKKNPAGVQDTTGNQRYRIRERKGVPIPYRTEGKAKLILGRTFGPLLVIADILLPFLWSILHVVGLKIAFGITWVLTPVFLYFMASGMSSKRRNERLMQYLRVLQLKGYASIGQLAKAIGKREKFVLKDVRKMISEGMLPEGMLDNSQTCLIATNEAAHQYSLALESYTQREQEAELRRREEERSRADAVDSTADNSVKKVSKEVRDTITKGRGYIAELKAINLAVPDAVITEKFNRLEIIIDRILVQIETNEEQLPEINKFMEYYLPTTIKLATAYKEFDAQPVQGENIIKAKAEISNTLDTINEAFEKLFDSLFEDAAMDVSTDISVLNTILKQEGLTKGDFEM